MTDRTTPFPMRFPPTHDRHLALDSPGSARQFARRELLRRVGQERLLDLGVSAGGTEVLRLFFRRLAPSQQHEVRTSHATEGEGAPAFWPWMQALRGLVGVLGTEGLVAALGPGVSELARLLPELHERLPELEAPDPLE